ncbi:hypothetical protein SELMODRAFT_408332 [Selaginella moellendorffii]|uniref:BHLH domain-containing protein n=1 Tax=Selaginella moellendorffii TaxID=88036 RepID=D8R7Y7_SELML|nr:hypothetical protein SELMODRAFT_408332 [Selaginella moellendorffii]
MESNLLHEQGAQQSNRGEMGDLIQRLLFDFEQQIQQEEEIQLQQQQRLHNQQQFQQQPHRENQHRQQQQQDEEIQLQQQQRLHNQQQFQQQPHRENQQRQQQQQDEGMVSDQESGLQNEENFSPIRSRHMIAERQRRRREAELLAALKSLLPFPTKRDKLSILQGAIRYVQELRTDCAASRSERGEGSITSKQPEQQQQQQQQTSSGSSGTRIRVRVEQAALVSALEHIKALGYEVDSIELNPPRTHAELVVHPIVQLSCTTGLQELLDQL